MLHNAGTLCNALLPLYGEHVADTVFNHCWTRYVNDVKQSTHIDAAVTATTVIHDLQWLLRKFAAGESFSIDTGGGGCESNINVSYGGLIDFMVNLADRVSRGGRCASASAGQF